MKVLPCLFFLFVLFPAGIFSQNSIFDEAHPNPFLQYRRDFHPAKKVQPLPGVNVQPRDFFYNRYLFPESHLGWQPIVIPFEETHNASVRIKLKRYRNLSDRYKHAFGKLVDP